jgi:hypothetical protein
MACTVKVTNVSLKATETDLWDFFAFSGEINAIQVKKDDNGETQTAFVTFGDEKALETAMLLSGAVIADKPVTVESVENYVVPSTATTRLEAVNAGASVVPVNQQGTMVPPAAPSTTRAEDVVTNMLAKGYILSKDAMAKAKQFDEQQQLSKTASERAAALGQSVSSTAASLDKRMGLSQKFSAGSATVNESLKSVDDKYRVTDSTKKALAVAEQRVNEVGSAIMQNSYVQHGASWISGAFSSVSKSVSSVGSKTMEKVQQEEIKRGGAETQHMGEAEVAPAVTPQQ